MIIAKNEKKNILKMIILFNNGLIMVWHREIFGNIQFIYDFMVFEVDHKIQ